MMDPLTTVPLLSLLAVASVIDWRVRRLPNALTIGGALFALVLHGTMGGFAAVALALTGWVVCLALFLPFYMSRGMAAGDVKLMAAVGAFLGPVGGVIACVCTLLAGGLIGLISLTVQRVTAHVDGSKAVAHRDALANRIPYAGAIALGSTFAAFGPWLVEHAPIQTGGLL